MTLLSTHLECWLPPAIPEGMEKKQYMMQTLLDLQLWQQSHFLRPLIQHTAQTLTGSDPRSPRSSDLLQSLSPSWADIEPGPSSVALSQNSPWLSDLGRGASFFHLLHSTLFPLRQGQQDLVGMCLQGHTCSFPSIYNADLRDRLLCSLHDDVSCTELRRNGFSTSLGSKDLHFVFYGAITGQHPEKSQIYYCQLNFS